MQAAAAQTGVRLSDGSTNILPVGRATWSVHDAWALHHRLVRRSLERGFYQGWDLHPAQLPTRYAATYAFFADGRGRGRRSGCAATWTGRPAASLTSRPRPGRWPATCCAAWTAAPWTTRASPGRS